jgi:hypothetical protein
MTIKRFLQYVRSGPGFCSGDFSKNCESLNLHSIRTVKAAGVQWGWVGFMFYRAVPIVPRETREEQITREKLSYLKSVALNDVWGAIVWILATGAIGSGLWHYFNHQLLDACYAELAAIFLILIAQMDWTNKHKIVMMIPGARANDKLQVLHTAASDGYSSDEGLYSEDQRCFNCGCYVDRSLLCSLKSCPNFGKAYFGKRAGYCSECAAPLEDDGGCSNLNCKEYPDAFDMVADCCAECGATLDTNGNCTNQTCTFYCPF